MPFTKVVIGAGNEPEHGINSERAVYDLVYVLPFILVILIIECVIPPAYYLGVYPNEFQQRNAEKITFSTEKSAGVGDSYVGIYD